MVLAPVLPQKQGQMEESHEYINEKFVPPDMRELLVRDFRYKVMMLIPGMLAVGMENNE